MSLQYSLNPNSQKTHYSIDLAKRKRQKVSQTPKGADTKTNIYLDEHQKNDGSASNAQRVEQKNTSPFPIFGNESADHVKHRFALYEKIWGHQNEAIESILNSANNELFASLLKYIQDPVSKRLDTAFLALSSNTANNHRLLDEFSSFIGEEQSENAHIRMVRLESKSCPNIKAAVREIIKQIVEGGASGSENVPEDEEEDVKVDNTELLSDSEGEFERIVEEDDDDEDSTSIFTGGRISYDFEIVQEWMDSYIKKYKCSEYLRIIIVFDDSDGFENGILNQLLQLICIYTRRFPIKMVMALSSRNVGDWINSNMTSKLRTLIRSVKLEAKDNKEIGFQVVDEILLQNEIRAENPLLLDSYLSSIILNRFEHANNSIDSLVNELKLSYMIHFYQSPLAVLIDPEFVPEKCHFDGLRRLPSFKTYIEKLAHQLEQNPKLDSGAKILRLISNNKQLRTLFEKSRVQMQNYQNSVMNAANMVYWLCGGKTEKFQIYKLITNNQLANSSLLSRIMKDVVIYSEEEYDEFVSFMFGPQIENNLASGVDEDMLRFKKELERGSALGLKNLILTYFQTNKHLNMKISDNLFSEVLTINGGRSEMDDLKPAVSIEENYENLMINLLRPNARELIETALDEPQKYLRNPLIMESLGYKRKVPRLLGPHVCKLYHVYKDAPGSINLWDFFVAFKQSLHKTQLLEDIERNLQSSEPESQRSKLSSLVKCAKNDESMWEKIVYGWFLSGCYDLGSIGLLKEKVKGDYMEKVIWKNL